ncbi:hypothetical protein SteCoe_7937 [Stentor coeruleus]|uniref:Uncharacterized protein n=1 Tax=Stentor coeruleus TaxID=5963 RepID=A0A1R2CLF8_9CILI|nr:hypothetical protein SteCoe_7937 [Stentor coeruleus]
MKSIAYTENPIETKDFQWLMKILSEIRNFSLQIPETLLFTQGVPSCFVYTTTKNRLRTTTNIKLNEIVSLFMKKVRQRKSPRKYSIEPVQRSIIENDYIRYCNKEIAVIRTQSNSLKTIENEALVNLLLEKSMSLEWSDIQSIQSVIKTSSSPGRIFLKNYTLSDILDQTPESKTILSISKSLKASNLTLIQGQFEFLIDDDGISWLSNVNKLQVKKIKQIVDSSELVPLRMSPDVKKHFFHCLDYHASRPKSKRIITLQKTMTDFYTEMKDKLRIDETLNTKFHFEVPQMTLPFLPEDRIRVMSTTDMFVTDPRNTIRTVRRLSLFQSNEFKTMRSSRPKGRQIFE